MPFFYPGPLWKATSPFKAADIIKAAATSEAVKEISGGEGEGTAERHLVINAGRERLPS